MSNDNSPGATMRWQCPDCRGGFPEPATDADGDDRCPWCGYPIMDLTGVKYEHHAE